MFVYYVCEYITACAGATVPYASTLHWCSAPPPMLAHSSMHPSGWQLLDKPHYLLIKKHSRCSAIIKQVNYVRGDCFYLLVQEQARLGCQLLRCRGDLGTGSWSAMEIGGCSFGGGFPKMGLLAVSSGEAWWGLTACCSAFRSPAAAEECGEQRR